MKAKFDFSRLKGRIVEKYDTYAAFADALGLPQSGLTARLKSKVHWKDYEMHKACDLLGIDLADLPSYFFVLKF